ncbi:MAG: NAD(P)/FAD-dependent oxidoreductase [Candidatus Aenigmarchaeota archaeon]|nr:NAD(P)/FAD-dependent oxidoreductase [Candidatus Aenigmarchaeota archaeon]
MQDDIFDVIVIGAAVAGSRTAGIIAESGRSVLLIEENTNVGHPCKCTGLVSWRIKELLPTMPEKLFVNTVQEARFYSPKGRGLLLKSKKPVYVIDRPGLDKYLFDLAQEAGVQTKINEKFVSYEMKEDHVEVKTDRDTYRGKIIIGADGANSPVGKQAGLKYPETYLVGVQTTAKGKFDKVELWFGSEVSPKFFAWVVPENENVARIGLATDRNASKYYEKFLSDRVGDFVKPDVGGIIRFGLMDRTSDDRLMVVGDAACQVKPYSGGGIVMGLISSKVCAEAALKSLKHKEFGRKFLVDNYDKKWKAKIGGGIKRGLALNKILNSSDRSLDMMMSAGRIGSKLLGKMDMDLINYFA